jgi:hypothetical protein
MTFFYDLNKKLAALSAKQDLTESAEPVAERSTGDYSAKKAAAGKDIGKPGKMFSKIAKSAGKEYGSKAAGERVAGAVLNKLRGKTNEADMEEGNEFSGELAKAKASGAKEFKVDGKTYPVKEGAKPDYIDLDKDGNKKETMKKAAQDAKGIEEKKEPRSKGTAFDAEFMKQQRAKKDAESHSRYDVKDTGYSKIYTRKHEEEPEADDDNKAKDDAPKRRGRPKGKDKGPERVTSKSYKYKAGRPTKTKEDLDSDGVMMTRPSNMSSEDIDSVKLTNKGEYDQEGDMAKDQLHTLVKAAKELHSILGDDQNLPEWVQSKITKALDYIKASNDYMDQERHDSEEMVPERKLSSSEKEEREDIVKGMKKNKGEFKKRYGKRGEDVMYATATKLAKERGPGNPDRKKKEESVAETDSAPKASKGGYNFGGGVYESMDKQFKHLLNEGMNVSVNMSTGSDGQPTKNITVSAEGEDAEALAALLKMAGLQGQSSDCGCGKTPCGCESLDENSPDWPTNSETSDDAMQYSGGLNGPKSTGQTTVPVVASQLRRQVSMEESVELERSLFKLYKEFK